MMTTEPQPMSAPTTPSRYTRTAIALHWLIALALLGAFAVGLYLQTLPLTPVKLKIISWHKWAGVTIFLAVLVRLAWRLTHQPPAPPTGLPAWQHHAAEWTHRLLYVLMVAIPLSGWLMSSAKGFPTVWFGLVQLPDLLAKDAALGDFLKSVHAVLNFTLAALVFAHVGAALKHHLIDRDEVLGRMLPCLARSRS